MTNPPTESSRLKFIPRNGSNHGVAKDGSANQTAHRVASGIVKVRGRVQGARWDYFHQRRDGHGFRFNQRFQLWNWGSKGFGTSTYDHATEANLRDLLVTGVRGLGSSLYAKGGGRRFGAEPLLQGQVRLRICGTGEPMEQVRPDIRQSSNKSNYRYCTVSWHAMTTHHQPTSRLSSTRVFKGW